MAQWVTVWRAAQLVGVPRGVLQRRVQAGEIVLADGLVSTERLLELYPQTEIEAGHLLFSYKLTVPLPFERGTFETEITGEYLVNLGAA